MVITLLFQVAVTPGGRFIGVPMPVAPVVEWVIGVRGVLMQRVGVVDGAAAVFKGNTVIVPPVLVVPQLPPVELMLNVNGDPKVVVGVPLILIVLPVILAFTPGGSPLIVAPVAEPDMV